MRKPIKEKPLANVLRLIRRDNMPSIVERSKAWGSFKEFADSFNENQPRDDHGKWSSGGSGTGDPRKPQEVSRGQVHWSQQYAEKQRADERQKRYDAFSNAHTAWERGGRQGLPPDHRKFGLTALGAAAARLDRTRIVNNSGQAAVHPTSPAERSEPPTSPAERADAQQHANLSLLWNPPKRTKDAKPRGLRKLAREIADDKDQLGHGSNPRSYGGMTQARRRQLARENKKNVSAALAQVVAGRPKIGDRVEVRPEAVPFHPNVDKFVGNTGTIIGTKYSGDTHEVRFDRPLAAGKDTDFFHHSDLKVVKAA